MSYEFSSEIISSIAKAIGNVEVSLHEPQFDDRDKEAMQDVIRSGFVSSQGPHLDQFELSLKQITGAKYAICVTNGTAAITLGLIASGIMPGEEVLVPSLTFVATGNAILQANAIPHFVETNSNNFGIDVAKLQDYLNKNSKLEDGQCVNIRTGKVISAIVPVHIFGHIGNISELVKLAHTYNLKIIEDAAEALGSYKHGKHAGCFGQCGALSFNGNKIITTGGGGAVITNDSDLATTIRHLATTAKLPHRYEYNHDRQGFNYRMPSLNAALGCAQISKLKHYLEEKKRLKNRYVKCFKNGSCCDFVENPIGSQSNNWLNAIKLVPEAAFARDYILDALNNHGFGSRPIWKPLSELPHFSDCPSMNLPVTKDLASRIINIPSSPFLVRYNYD